MSTEQLSSFTSTVSVNPYSNKYVIGASSFLTLETNPQYSKEQFVASYLNTQSYISNQIEISKNIPQEDVLDAINIKIYDELGLDQAVEYQVQYIETFNNLDSENRHFQVFIVDPLEINEIYQEVVQKIKYIDVITPAPLLIKSLYSKEIIEDNGIHCFIYFEENDSFITIYNEKEFVYTKSLNYSLEQMHERFCELYGERIEYDEFILFLSTQNLKDTTSDYKTYVLKLYKEMFANINDILTYTKKAFEIEKVEQIYIGSQINTASKLYEISEVELSIKSSDFYFDYGFKSENEIDQLHSLMHISTTLSEEEKYTCNFSTFHRPPKFTKRESGKLIMLIAASFFIAFIYPVSYWVLIYTQEVQYNILADEYDNVVHKEKVTRQAIIKTKEADKAKEMALLEKEKQNYTDKKSTLIKIHEVKVNYPMKSKLLTILTKELNRYSLKIDQIKYNEAEDHKTFSINIKSKNDKKITQLLEDITKKYDKKFSFELEEIFFDEKDKNYLSELKVSIL